MLKRIFKLMFGLGLFSIGIIMTVKAQIGYAPWDTFHYGLSNVLGLSYGLMTIIVGGATVGLAVILGERIGIGTLLNMTLIGVLCDLLLNYNIIRTPNQLWLQIAMLLAGLMIMSFASYFYISSGLGAGPRDSLMVALTKRLKLPVGVCRNIIELSVLVIGWRLGGTVGIGTILSALLMGVFVQGVFKLLKFDARKVKQLTIQDMRESFSSSRPNQQSCAVAETK